MDMNQVILVGRLADDVIYKEAVGETSSRAVARLIINRAPGPDGQKRYDAVQLVAWGKHADNLAKYTRIGKELGIVGELRSNSVAPQKVGGEWKNYTEVLIRSISFGRDSNKAKFMKALEGGTDVAAQAAAIAGLQSPADGVDIAAMLAANPQLLTNLRAVVQGAQPSTPAQAETTQPTEPTTTPVEAAATGKADEDVPEDSDQQGVRKTDSDDSIHDNSSPFNDAE